LLHIRDMFLGFVESLNFPPTGKILIIIITDVYGAGNWQDSHNEKRYKN